MIKNFNYLFVTLFGLGSIRYIPGTVSSLVTTIFLFSLFHILNISNYIFSIFFIVIFFYSFFSVSKYIKKSENKDPKEVVIDEFIGQTIPIFLYEISHGSEKNIKDIFVIYFVIFLLFRFFDILKPYPANLFDRKFKNSFGVIFDDVVAGLYVVITLIIFMVLKSKFFS